jgi:hypothetical protein
MHLVIDQPIETSASKAQEAFLDPAFYQSLGQLESISPPVILALSCEGGWAHLELRYRFSGELSGPARRILDPAKLSWVQVTDVNLVARRSEVQMVPDHYANLLKFSGWYELRDLGGRPAKDLEYEARPERCVQHFEADLRVNVPLLGGLAERAIAGSILRNVAETAWLVGRYELSDERSGENEGSCGSGGTSSGA